jgi:hypothetical protein
MSQHNTPSCRFLHCCCSVALTAEPVLRKPAQAFINKHFKGCNTRWFAPERIRELAPSERGERGAATFVSLEGLGKIPFSNIRRPKPLMDVGNAPSDNQVTQEVLHLTTFLQFQAAQERYISKCDLQGAYRFEVCEGLGWFAVRGRTSIP